MGVSKGGKNEHPIELLRKMGGSQYDEHSDF